MARRQRLGRQHVGDQPGQFLLVAAAFAAHPQGQHRRVEQQYAVLGHHRMVGHPHRRLGLGGEGQVGQPGGVAGLDLQAHRLAGQQRGGHRLGGGRIGDVPARRRFVQRDAQLQFAGGGDGGHAAQDVGDPAGQLVGAVMAAQQRHGGGTVGGDGDHRRFRLLADEMGATARSGMLAAQTPTMAVPAVNNSPTGLVSANKTFASTRRPGRAAGHGAGGARGGRRPGRRGTQTTAIMDAPG